MDWNSLFNAMVNVFFVGIGSATATYIVTRSIVKNIERLEDKLKEKNGNGKAV
jgi:hypothetical protein